MSQPFLGEVRTFTWNWAPKGWALCNGALLSIAQNSALFSLLGTTYGGNGQTNFGLPDLQGRVPISRSQAYPQPTRKRLISTIRRRPTRCRSIRPLSAQPGKVRRITMCSRSSS